MVTRQLFRPTEGHSNGAFCGSHILRAKQSPTEQLVKAGKPEFNKQFENATPFYWGTTKFLQMCRVLLISKNLLLKEQSADDR